MKLILASGSKTRYDLLNSLHISFQVEPVELVEDVTATLPEEHCQEISRRKAERISKNHNDGLIIAAESKVFYRNKAYGKPKTEKEAKKNLKIFFFFFHDVITGVTIYDLYQDKMISFYEKTEVTFRKLSSSMIQNYIDQEKNIYQRCGYGLSAFSFISKIHGDITNLYGLPMKKLEKELALLGYTLDDFKDVKVLKK